MATSIFAEQALLADGWQQNVRLSIADGSLSGIEVDASPAPSDERHAIF